MTLHESVIELALRRGFFFPSSEIYAQAPAGFFEYGPLGVAMRNRFLEHWRNSLLKPEEMIEIDGSSIMPRQVFASSGHLEGFAELIVKCEKCHSIFRADRLVSEHTKNPVPERTPASELDTLIRKEGIKCPNCKGELSEATHFSTMFAVQIGPNKEEAYLRPETAQSIFVDFSRISKTMRVHLPFAIAQYGEVFRNEISPRQALIRLRELHQAEIEIFFNPKKDLPEEKFRSVEDQTLHMLRGDRSNSQDELEKLTFKRAVSEGIMPYRLIAYHLARLQEFYIAAGIGSDKIRFRHLNENEKAFYAKVGLDLEVKTSLGWTELVACNYRGDFDLSGHSKGSGQDLSMLDDGEKVLPHVFELSMGVDRSLYAILELSYAQEPERVVLKIPPKIAPFDAVILPLVPKDGLEEKASLLYQSLGEHFDVSYDESGSIGRRYRRNDEIGVPGAVTVDYQTLKDDTVTLRDRDSMGQLRTSIPELSALLQRFLNGEELGFTRQAQVEPSA